MEIKKQIEYSFKPNDIRGIYPKEIDENLFYKIGQAFGKYVSQKEIIVGHDMRESSESLCRAFTDGILSVGKNVCLIGCIGTDMLWLASGKLKKHGAMITASHNPAKYNGIKLCKPGAVPINEKTGLNEIKKLTLKEIKGKKMGKLKNLNIEKKYAKHVLSFVDKSKIKNFKIVVDAGNGMAAKTFCIVYKNLKLKIDTLDFKLDGNFPKHVANPFKHKNIHDLEVQVRKKKTDFGIAFDGDTDRAFFVDEKGKRISSSIIGAIMIKYLLKKKKKPVIYNLVCSKIVPETIKKYGGRAIVERVGHSFIKHRMKKEKALFACEHSGHFYFSKIFNSDSGMIASLLVCEIFANENKKMSEITKEFKKYHQIDEISVKVKDKEQKLKKLEKIYKKQKPIKISYLDGITIVFEDYWFNLRPSNTEPLLRVNLEAKTHKIMIQKRKEVLKILK